MYVHVHRKIEVSKELSVTSIAWGGTQNYICCGASDGSIKLLHLDEPKKRISKVTDEDSTDSSNSNVTITVIDRLEHKHKGKIKKLSFDDTPSGNKLTSADDDGLICAWRYSKKTKKWIEDMTNQRKATFVSDFNWSPHSKLGIVYRDGFCLIGDCEGNREWAQESDFELLAIAWSPDPNNQDLFIVVTMNYECLLYAKDSNTSKYIKYDSISLAFFDKLSNDAMEICDICWNQNVLCIAYKIGKMQIMKDYNDKHPILIDVDMIITKIKLNPLGTIIAIVGRKKVRGDYSNWLCFIDCFGQILYQLAIPTPNGSQINDFCWEMNGHRVIICIENIVYFAQICTSHKFGYFAKSFLCYSDANNEMIYFWDHCNESLQTKQFESVHHICGHYDSQFVLIYHKENEKMFASLYNTIGRETTKNEIVFANPNQFVVTSQFVIICSKFIIYYFQHTHNKKLIEVTMGNLSDTSLTDKMVHIDNFNQNQASKGKKRQYQMSDKSKNPIESVCGHNEFIIIARRFGDITCYSMLNEGIEFKLNTQNQGIKSIAVNNDISRLSVINKDGTLQIYDVYKKQIILERSDKKKCNVRDIVWSYDDNLRFVVVDKSKLIIYNDLSIESGAKSKIKNNQIALFKDLEIITFDLNELQLSPNNPSLKQHCTMYECKILSKMNELLMSATSSSARNGGVYSAYKMLVDLEETKKKNVKFTKLWQLLCYDALKKLDFEIAETCFVKLRDFFGVQFIKRLKLMNERNKQRAEIYAYFGNLEDAEMIYSKMSDKKEALSLLQKMGNFEKVIALIKKEKNKNFNDKQINNVYKQIGDYYQSNFDWQNALKYYLKSKDYANASIAAFKNENFAVLNQIIKQIPSSSNLLKKISKMLIANGLTKESSDALIKYGDILSAIKNCIDYNDYKLAKEIAIKYDHLNDFDALIKKKLNKIDKKQNIFQIIDIYVCIKEHLKAAKLLNSYIEKLKKQSNREPYLFQKMYVLSAIQMDEHRKGILFNSKTSNALSSKHAIDMLLEEDVGKDLNDEHNTSLFGGQCWNGAIAYNLFILLTKQIHSAQITTNSVFICRVLCSFFDDVLDEIDIYSLYAFVSFKCRYFKDCSIAMTRLQFLCNQRNRKNDDLIKSKFKQLAINIFTQNDPINDESQMPQIMDVNEKEFDIRNVCMASGQYIRNAHIKSNTYHICSVCKYKTLKIHLNELDYCPLCHSSLDL